MMRQNLRWNERTRPSMLGDKDYTQAFFADLEAKFVR
jgi:hypothetical protein